MNRSEGQWKDPDVSLSYHTSSDKQWGENHEIQAHTGDGKEIGHLTWNPEHGGIKFVGVNKDHRRKGIASHMWDLAHQQAKEHGGVVPRHQAYNMSNNGWLWSDNISPGWWKK